MVTLLESKSSKMNYFLISLSSSSILSIAGLILLLFQITTPITLFGLVIFLIGIIQVIVDLGWISITQINRNLPSWKEAYPIVAKKRNFKLFIVPFLFDLSFVILSIAVFTVYGLKL